MMFKFVALLSFVCLTRAGLLENEAYASPEISYVAPAIGGISHGAASPALSAITQANYADSTPAVSYADSAINYAAPAISYAAPAVAYSSPVIGAAPVSTYAAPVAYTAPVAKAYVAENYAPAHYDFGYAVNDPHTGDSKSHEESRRGDVVQGRYSLIDSDGTKRTVEYSADAHNGFNAVVHKEPIGHAGPVVKIAAPVAYSPAVAPTYYH